MALSTTITPPKGWWKANASVATSANSIANNISFTDVPTRAAEIAAAREEAGLEGAPSDALAPTFDEAYLQLELSLGQDPLITRTEKRHKLYFDGSKQYWRTYEIGYNDSNQIVYTKCLGESYERPADVPANLTSITQIETPSTTSYTFKFPVEIVGGKAIIK